MTFDELEAILAFNKLRASPAGLLREVDFAKLLGKSARTVRRYRELGTMPPHIVLGNQAWYEVTAIASFLSGTLTEVDKLRQTRTDPDKKDVTPSAVNLAFCSVARKEMITNEFVNTNSGPRGHT